MAREGKEKLAWQKKEKRDLHSKIRKREISMAREGKEKFAWQEKEKRDLHGKRRTFVR